MQIFSEVKRSFETIVSDQFWFFKLLFASVLLINPLLILAALNQNWTLAYCLIGINALTFWLPLGFTMEVLRRSRNGTIGRLGLPSWDFPHWGTYLRDGAVKFCIALFTLIIPSTLWIAGCVILSGILKQPIMIGMAVPLVFFFTIPFCAVGCCRWLDTGDLLGCALDYRLNFEFYRFRWSEYSIATLLLMGLTTIGGAFIVSMPLVSMFGLCLVDTWFGPIYGDSVRELNPGAVPQPRPLEAGEVLEK